MSGTSDKIKGRVKEAVGALTDDQRLKREGKLDQTTGKIKKFGLNLVLRDCIHSRRRDWISRSENPIFRL